MILRHLFVGLGTLYLKDKAALIMNESDRARRKVMRG